MADISEQAGELDPSEAADDPSGYLMSFLSFMVMSGVILGAVGAGRQVIGSRIEGAVSAITSTASETANEATESATSGWEGF